MRRRVVITGMGAVTPLGNDVPTFWQGLREGRCGIGPITHYDTSSQKVKLAGEVKDLPVAEYIDAKAAKRMDPFTQFAIIAAKQAYQQAGLTPENVDAERFGVLISSGIGGLNTIETEMRRGLEKGFDRVSPFFVPMNITNLAAGNVAIELGAKGMCSCVVTACAGGTNAIGDAFRQIRDGYLDVIAAGGTESSITPLGVGGFTSMKALCTKEDPARGSIPFDAERSGFVMGEGAGVLMLEEYEHAKARGAAILGELVGYGLPYHRPFPQRRRRRPGHDHGHGVRRHRAGTDRLYQCPWHIDSAQRQGGDFGCQTGLWPGGVSGGHQLHQIHDGPPAGGQRCHRGGGHGDGPAGVFLAAHHPLSVPGPGM